MGPVHVGVGHDDNFVVAEFFRVKLLPDPRPQSGDDGAEFVIAIDPVSPGLFHVEHFAPQGENGLEPGVPALGG